MRNVWNELCVMIQKHEAKFKGKLSYTLKNDIRSLFKFFEAAECLKTYISIGYFCQKHIEFYIKNYRRVISYDTEE